MEKKIVHGSHRKAISPIIATVLIIAATLVAAVAIGGFVFGLFGSSTQTAQVQSLSSSLGASAVTNAAATSLVYTCTAGPAGQLVFSNPGSATTTVLSLTISFGGGTYAGAAPAGCNIVAGGSVGITFTTFTIKTGSTLPTSGSQYTGYIVTSNGAQVVFTGTWQ